MQSASIWLVAAVLAAAVAASSARGDEWQPGVASAQNSRLLAQAFAAQLKTALTQAMHEEGAAAAISVCRDLAPQLAAQMSRQSGAKVGRTSRKFRNPANAPEPWQRRVLAEHFDDALPASIRREEYFVRDDDGARYMQAIRLAGICTACHGQNIGPQLRKVLAEHYPYDLATGYQPGALRGAFSVSWPPPLAD